MSKKESFLFIASWYDILKAYERADEAFAHKLAMRIIDYGVAGELDPNDEIINGLINSMCAPLINRSKNRYNACVVNGKTGGRPTRYNQEEIISLYKSGMTYEEIANNLGCSVRTVQRALEDYNKNSTQQND